MKMTVDGETIANASYTYKPDGLVDKATLPLLGGSQITYAHDELNRPVIRMIAPKAEAE